MLSLKSNQYQFVDHKTNKGARLNSLTAFSLFLLIGISGCNICEEFGSTYLGNRIALPEGDKIEDRVIVFCTDSEGCCNGGLPIIPSNSDKETSYVDEVRFDDKWIIVRTIDQDKLEKRYWIIDKTFKITEKYCDNIDCEGIISKYTKARLTEAEFEKKKTELGIQVAF